MNIVVRKGTFDAGHRIVNHSKIINKCKNIHGHTFKWELHLGFETTDRLGYVMDFSEIKRRFNGFLQKYLDHSYIYNPKDKLVEAIKKVDTDIKLFKMTLNKDEYCNPSAENLGKTLFYIAMVLFPELKVAKVRLFETQKSFVDITEISDKEKDNLFKSELQITIQNYLKGLTEIHYGD